ncbi:hypothetical protein SSE37_12831 [Sagittula stellata E-37]|uniref:Uncharacterized protein n=1 Tax=Sagittula stellata (strain ATCC 700073 / DSM 11524 / E-37) TaxID=388399 RepID=A3K6V5_SAGS3|nr:hypothetical protein SSE37_12831 [Sagittula stellata E-37]
MREADHIFAEGMIGLEDRPSFHSVEEIIQHFRFRTH